MQPSFGSIRPVLVMADFGLKLSYPVFGPAKLGGSLRFDSTACWWLTAAVLAA
jgi:hypothetical protein